MTPTHPPTRARAILLAATGAMLCALFAATGAQAQHRDDRDHEHAERGAQHGGAPPQHFNTGAQPPHSNGGPPPQHFNSGGAQPPHFNGGPPPQHFNTGAQPPRFNGGPAPQHFNTGGAQPPRFNGGPQHFNAGSQPEHFDRGPQQFDRGPQHFEHADRGHFDRGPIHFDHDRQHVDGRFHHDQVYYNRGVFVSALPRAHYGVVHGGVHYYFAGGVWYAPRGVGWVVVAPPFGVYVPVLPAFYTTLWVGGVPYYYANDVYYAYRGPEIGYEVVAPPPDDSISTQPGPDDEAPQAPPSSELFVYPNNGQSEDQQAQDRYECHTWAQSQTGFDPTTPNGGVPPDQTAASRADYDRAMSACLEGRGYTVK